MKKIVFTVSVFLLACLLAAGVFAQGEITVTRVKVDVTEPVKGETCRNVTSRDVTIEIVQEGENRNLSHLANEFALSPESGWYENNTGSDQKLAPDATFISGRQYTLRVIFSLNLLDCEIDGNTELLLGSKKATLSKQGSQAAGTVEYMLSASFVCTSNRLAPMVSLSLEGEAEKAYDGKDVILTASVQKDEGVEYQYQWYHNGRKLEKETASSIKIRNVAQSGKYYCEVSATVPGSSEAPGVTESALHDITITPISIVVQLENAEKNLFDEDPKFTYTVLGDVFDALEGEPGRKAGEDIGSYPITQGTLAFAEEVAANYEIQFKEGKFTILSAGELPFSAVVNLADLSYITGFSGSKIRVSASKGAIPEGGILSLRLPSDKVQSVLPSLSENKVMKSFAVSLMDANGKTLSLPKHGTLRIQIPLSEEEMKQIPETITAVLYTGTANPLSATYTHEENGVIYLVVETKDLGTIALFEGQQRKDTEPGDTDSDQKGVSPLFWVLIITVSLLAVGGIVFTALWTAKNRKKPENKKESEKKEKAAPVPEGKEEAPKSEKPLEEKEEKEEKSPKKKEKKVISFEDLEN